MKSLKMSLFDCILRVPTFNLTLLTILNIIVNLFHWQFFLRWFLCWCEK